MRGRPVLRVSPPFPPLPSVKNPALCASLRFLRPSLFGFALHELAVPGADLRNQTTAAQ